MELFQGLDGCETLPDESSEQKMKHRQNLAFVIVWLCVSVLRNNVM